MVYLEFFNFLHFVGLAFGLGGATIATIISIKSEKYKEVALAMNKIIPSISKLIMFGLVLLIISGIALPFFITWPLNSTNLIIKHILVVFIVIFGITMGTKSKKIMKLMPKPNEKPSLIFIKTKRQVKTLSIINLILWYAVTLLSAFV